MDFRDDQGLVDERGQQIEDVPGLQIVARTRRGCCIERKAAGEHRDAPQERLFLRREQVEAPVDERAHGLLARQRGSAAAGQNSKSLIQSREQLVHVHSSYACSGEL